MVDITDVALHDMLRNNELLPVVRTNESVTWATGTIRALAKDLLSQRELNRKQGRHLKARIDEQPRLGYATTEELISELHARIDVDGNLNYRTVGSPAPIPEPEEIR